MFSFLKEKLSKNTDKIKAAFRGEIILDDKKLDEILYDLEISLIESDIALEVVEKIIGNLKSELRGKKFKSEELSMEVKKILKSSLREIFVDEKLIERIKDAPKPFVIAFVGINGTGKTTTIAKVATYLQGHGLTSVIAASDTYRAGAIEQIEKHAEKLGIRLVKHRRGADSAAVAFDAIEHARAKGREVVLIDTAGRMDTNINLMDELKKIVRVSKPNATIFVGDMLTGNAVVEQVDVFNRFTPIDGAILTKADADAKGGSAISIAYVLKKPIFFLGTGQGYGDLIEFDSDWFVNEIITHV